MQCFFSYNLFGFQAIYNQNLLYTYGQLHNNYIPLLNNFFGLVHLIGKIQETCYLFVYIGLLTPIYQ